MGMDQDFLPYLGETFIHQLLTQSHISNWCEYFGRGQKKLSLAQNCGSAVSADRPPVYHLITREVPGILAEWYPHILHSVLVKILQSWTNYPFTWFFGVFCWKNLLLHPLHVKIPMFPSPTFILARFLLVKSPCLRPELSQRGCEARFLWRDVSVGFWEQWRIYRINPPKLTIWRGINEGYL